VLFAPHGMGGCCCCGISWAGSYTGELWCICSVIIGGGWVREMVCFLLGCAPGRGQQMNGRNRPYYAATPDGMGWG
jgi:hypothetical protein